MKIKLNIILVVCISYSYASAQNAQLHANKLRLNNVNIEALGSGIGYSINYDRVFQLDSIVKPTLSVGYEFNDSHFMLTQINILFGKIHHLEIGVGYLYCIKSLNNDEANILSFRLGYRYENFYRRGLVFRFGFTPLINYNLEYSPIGSFLMGIAVGYNF